MCTAYSDFVDRLPDARERRLALADARPHREKIGRTPAEFRAGSRRGTISGAYLRRCIIRIYF